jgi:signal transduction histidine kinase
VLAILRDVDERVRMREATMRHQKELEAANASLEAFTHVVSHDLKEPVRAMSMYLQEIRDNPKAPDREALIERAANAEASLERFLAGLLEWSRMSMTPLEPEILHVQDVLRDPGCATQFQNLIDERRAVLQVSPEIPFVYATESLLCRIFGNLITNAIRHNPGAAPHVRIAPGTSAPPNRVEILVDDNGPGFPEKVKERMRRPKREPTTLKGGFGLAITSRAIDRLGGELHLDDAPGGGGRVRVHLPKPPTVRRNTLEERVKELV